MSNSTAFVPPLPAALMSLPLPALVALTAFVVVPIAAIAINVAWQLVCFFRLFACMRQLTHFSSLFPAIHLSHLLFSIGFPLLARQLRMVMTLLAFSLSAVKRFVHVVSHRPILTRVSCSTATFLPSFFSVVK